MAKTPDNDHMTSNIIHVLLVNSNALQQVPAPFVLAYIVGFALIIGLVGDGTLGAVYTVTGLGNWGLLWMLPRLGLSFGPDRPSALALATATGILMLLIAVVGLPLWVAIILCLLVLGVVYYSTYVEPFALGVTHEKLTVANWPSDVGPLRMLHIGDIHIERITRRERKLNQMIKDLQPDVIVFSGDFVNISYTNDPLAMDHIRQIIGEWTAPLGVYCVSGTHTVEPLDRVKVFVDGLDNLRFLDDEWVSLDAPGGPVHVLGMITTHYLEIDRPKVKDLMDDAPGEGVKVLLTHAPDVAPEADEAGYDLYVCGHTHGGQLRFPVIGAVFSGSQLGMQFVMGRYDLQTVTVYTSRGVGLEGLGAPRARFLCPPEIILWEIGG